MPERVEPPRTPSQTQTLREEPGSRLSRSPHPYHRQNFELHHASEQLNTNAPLTKSLLRPSQLTDDDELEDTKHPRHGYLGFTNSDSGTEADDEHFLKGLPAPKYRPHKGLRGSEGRLSGTSSPLLSPALLDEDIHKILGNPKRFAAPSSGSKDDELRNVAERLQRKRQAEIIRRTTEASILAFVAGILCFNAKIRELLWILKTELICQTLVIASLIALYPLRLVLRSDTTRRWMAPIQFRIPLVFDPAPLLYPPAITMLVSTLLSVDNPAGLLPSIILAISSLPKHLIPGTGGLEGANTIQWFLSCLPLLSWRGTGSALVISQIKYEIDPEASVLIYPLHQALCTTLQSLTTTSLLTAELQLLSIALIDLLLLAKSPQALILKSLLWGGGIGILVSCFHVLKWGVALARVPKWRLRRPASMGKSHRGARASYKRLSFGDIGASFFVGDGATSDTNEEDINLGSGSYRNVTPPIRVSTDTQVGAGTTDENGSVSAVEKSSLGNFQLDESIDSGKGTSSSRRRHTLSTITHFPERSSRKTSSGRRKRALSISTQSFFSLTQGQAAFRKWSYAAYVYICVLVIILVGIREYVGAFALHDHEPVGWALGYLFGDIPQFRMEVVTGNFQRWICLPPRGAMDIAESCRLGWVEHLRHSSFGEANTRLILCAYWLSIITVGLAIVFRLSSIYEVDTRRKVFHFMMVAMLLPATYVDPTFAALALILMLAIFLLLDLFRASQLPPLSKSLAYFLTPYVDGRDLKGPVVISHIFLLIGCAIPLWLSLGSLPRAGTGYLAGWEVSTREVSMVSGVICVGMGDAAASLIGRRYGRHKWVWGGGKSLEGSAAFAAAVFLALVLAKAWLRVGGWPANNDDSWVATIGKTGVAAGLASLTEAVLTGGNDNVVVPVVLWLCVKGLDV